MPRIVNNRICFLNHNIVLDPALHATMPDYIFEIAEGLSEAGGPSDHRQELEDMNNDGSWTIELPTIELKNHWHSESAERRGDLPTQILAIVTLHNGSYNKVLAVFSCTRNESFQPIWRALREAKLYFGRKARKEAETEYFKKYDAVVSAYNAAHYEDPACFI